MVEKAQADTGNLSRRYLDSNPMMSLLAFMVALYGVGDCFSSAASRDQSGA